MEYEEGYYRFAGKDRMLNSLSARHLRRLYYKDSQLVVLKYFDVSKNWKPWSHCMPELYVKLTPIEVILYVP